MTRQIPNFVRDLVNTPPLAGEGVHGWLFRVSRQLHAHLPAVEIVALLESRVVNCGRHVPRSEVLAAVQNSIRWAWTSNARAVAPPPRRWPELDTKLHRELLADGGGLADLWEASPWRLNDNQAHTEQFIDHLFPGNPLICCGASNAIFATKPREDWRGNLDQLQLIVPSPMSAITGLTRAGKESAHTLNNTGPRRFLVVEFDQGTADEHAVILLHLAQRAPLAIAVHSGGKSLHGWFFCASQPEQKLRRFMEYAVTLGADKATWCPAQFVRLPDGIRDTGRRQTVFFFNPDVVK